MVNSEQHVGDVHRAVVLETRILEKVKRYVVKCKINVSKQECLNEKKFAQGEQDIITFLKTLWLLAIEHAPPKLVGRIRFPVMSEVLENDTSGRFNLVLLR